MNATVDDKLLDWVEAAALENIRSHMKSGDDIKRESNIALALVVAGASAALAYTIKGIEFPTNVHVTVGAGFLSLYLFALAAFLVFRCLFVEAFPAPTNVPRNLFQKEYPLSELREVELKNIQNRIDDAARINHKKAAHLNQIWFLATASPLVFVGTFLLSYLGAHLF